MIFAIFGGVSLFSAHAVEEDPVCPTLPVGTIAIIGKCEPIVIMGITNGYCNTMAVGLGDCAVEAPPIEPEP
ncbi:hypothetical protein LV85_01756 [Algoriphagus chordae]|uniref:Uncharacterized protein n=1 Tax=Algoriphagus chordae TaxID=237019 RepID=A0A2W7QXS9_9BACT|nr:hypothetical protein LV85_01756 [Algoriphagus chordae]